MIYIGIVVKSETKKIFKDQIKLLLRILALSTPVHLFNASCGFQKYENRFNPKTYLATNLAITTVYFCYRHT